MRRAIFLFLKKETVLVIAACVAIISTFFVPPSWGYVSYIDFHVLILLFCLMTVVSGIRKCGFFEVLAERMCEGEKNLRTILLVLIFLPFFASMLITNDVALLTFVPFAILVLHSIGQSRRLILTIVLQTIAANLGSMVTPIGNPQNLFLYSRFFSSSLPFFQLTIPFMLLSIGMLSSILFFIKNERVQVYFVEKKQLQNPRKLVLWILLFFLCLLSVFHVVNDWVLLSITILVMFLFERDLFRCVDYSLLLTFVCFFIFAGNIAQMDIVRWFLEVQMGQHTGLCTVLTSQIISNVPAVVMLSKFTSDGDALLIYSNLGGLGTIIASLASLISFKLYLRVPQAKPIRYLLVFTIWNLAFLAILGIFSVI